MAIRCVHAFTPSTCIVAGGNPWGGIYRSTNGGGAWAYTEAGNPNDIYFPTELVGYAAGEGNSVYKTVDAGVTWTDLGPVVPAPQFTVFFHDELRGWTGGAGSGSRTMDGGGTWVAMGSIPSYTKSIIFTDADTGYAVGQSGQTVRNVDGGVTWENFIGEVFNATFGDAALVDGALIGVANNGDIYRAQLRCPVNGPVPHILQVDGELCTADANSIQWYLNDDPINGAIGPCHNPVSTGTYHVLTNDVQGCPSAPSEPIAVISTGLEERVKVDELPVYPNPVDDLLMLRIPQGQVVDNAEILDVQGRVVKRISSVNGLGFVGVSDLKSGLYVMRCGVSGRAVEQRFVKKWSDRSKPFNVPSIIRQPRHLALRIVHPPCFHPRCEPPALHGLDDQWPQHFPGDQVPVIHVALLQGGIDQHSEPSGIRRRCRELDEPLVIGQLFRR